MPDRSWLLLALCFPAFLVGADMLAIVAVIDPITHRFLVSPGLLSLLISANLFGLAVSILPIRALCRKVASKYILIIGLVLLAATGLIGANASHFFTVILVRLSQGIGFAAVMAAIIALLPSYFERSQRRILARYIALWSVIGIAAGPVIGGICVQYVSWHLWFAVSGIAALIALVPALGFVPKIKLSHDQAIYCSAEIWRRPRFLRALVGSLFSYFALYMWLIVFAIYLPRVMACDPLQVGLALLAFAVAFAIAAYQVHIVIKQYGLRLVVTCSLLLVILASASLLLTNRLMPYWAFLSLFVLLGLGLGAFSVGMMVYGLEGLNKKTEAMKSL